MPSWDTADADAQRKAASAALARQVQDRLAPFSLFYRQRLSALGLRPSDLTTVADLVKVPPVGERDVCPAGDPADAAALVLRPDISGFTRHADGPLLRRALRARIRGGDAYARAVERAVRPVSFHLGGLAFHFPVAATRADADVIARAGARAWAVLGLDRSDALVSAVGWGPFLTSGSSVLAVAHAAGAPALGVGPDPGRLAEVCRLLQPRVLALPAGSALEVLEQLCAQPGARGALVALRTLLVVGHPDPAERRQVAGVLPEVTAVLPLWGPPDARVLWAGCPGNPDELHTYPDLEICEFVDPGTAEPAADGGELVLTQLGLAGTALLRWRTGALVEQPPGPGACPGCQRSVPRLGAGLAPRALVPALEASPGVGQRVDLRAVAGVFASRADLQGWQLRLRRSDRTGLDQVLAVIRCTQEPGRVAGELVRDVRRVAGVALTQVIVEDSEAAPGEAWGTAAHPRSPALGDHLVLAAPPREF